MSPNPLPALAGARGRQGPRAHAPLIVILAAFALLAAAYGATVPLGEPPDELAHYRYVRHIDATGRPPLTPEERNASGYKGHEPPLYYLLLHRATAWLRISQRPMLKLIDPDLQPRHSIGAEVLLWNAVLHTADEAFPWHGTSLAWHLMRLISIPLGMVTILGVYRVGRIVAPRRPIVAVLAAGLTAFTPQFVYLSGAVNNDNLAIPLSVLALATLVAMAAGNLRWRQFLLVGVLAGLARVTKFHTLVLLPVMALSLALIAWRHRAWGRCALGGLLALAVIVLVSVPWALAVQPDGPTSGAIGLASAFLGLTDTMHAQNLAAGGEDAAGLMLGALRLDPLRWAWILFQSYWAFFGQMTVAVGRGVYLGLAIVVALGIAGALRLALRRSLPAGVAVLALGALAFLGVEWTFYGLMRRLPDTAQGRHLYPALPAWSLLLAAGLLAWVPKRTARPVTAGMVIAMAGLAAYLLPGHALAAYEPALPVRTTLPAAWRPEVGANDEAAPGITYLGCSPAVVRAEAGRTAALSLLWRAGAPIDGELLLRVEYAAAASLDDQTGGAWRLLHLAQPAGGRWPTRAWDPGDNVWDRHDLLVPPGLAVGEYALRAVWADCQGRPVGLPVTGCRLRVTATGDPPTEPLASAVPASANGVLRYRQGMVVVARPDAPGKVTEGLTSTDGAAWRPIAAETHPAGGGEIVEAFYVVDQATRAGRYPLPGAAAGGAPREVRVEARYRQFDAPDDMRVGGWRFGGQDDGDGDGHGGIALVGYRLDGAAGGREAAEAEGRPAIVAGPGETVGLELAWRAEGWIGRNYTVFTHLVGADDVPLAQHDGIPRDGYATLFWAPGEVVVDYHPLTLPADLAPGLYRTLVGLYTQPDGARLPVVGPGAEEASEATAAAVATIQVVNEGER